MKTHKLATIVPVGNLNVIESHRYHMALTHLLSIPEYFEFYRKQVESGSFVILDNSTVELGRPERLDTYLDKAVALGTTEVLLPDWLFERVRTIDAMIAGLTVAKEVNYSGQFMVVPQGRDPEEWLHCLKLMLEFPIHSIGISKRYHEMFGVSRLMAVLAARRVIEYAGRTDVKIHLLGCEQFPELDVAPCLELPYVRGVDSSLPAKFAFHQERLEPGKLRPSPQHMLDLEDAVIDNNTLVKSVAAWQQLCSDSEFHRKVFE